MKKSEAVLAGYFGFDNLGDELLLLGTVSLFEQAGVSRSELIAASASPQKTAETYGLRTVDRWKVLSLFKALRGARRLVFAGGGIFQDRTSLRSVFYYAGLVALARLAGCRVWAIGQSVGPLEGGLARSLTRWALKRCSLLTVRDSESVEVCHQLGLACRLVPDLSLALTGLVSDEPSGGAMLLNVRPGHDDLAASAAAAAGQAAQQAGLPLIGVAMAPEDERALEQACLVADVQLAEVVQPSVDDPTGIFARAKAAFGMRLHFGALALLTGRDYQAVSYDPKVAGFVRQWGGAVWSGGPAKCVPWKNRPALSGAAETLRRVLQEALTKEAGR